MSASVKPEITVEQQQERIQKFLKALPHLELSDKGLENVSKRFGVTVAVIQDIADNIKK